MVISKAFQVGQPFSLRHRSAGKLFCATLPGPPSRSIRGQVCQRYPLAAFRVCCEILSLVEASRPCIQPGCLRYSPLTFIPSRTYAQKTYIWPSNLTPQSLQAILQAYFVNGYGVMVFADVLYALRPESCSDPP